MPNVDDLKKRQEVRALRKQHREEHVEKAHAQDFTLSDQQQQNQVKTDAAALAAAERAQRDAAGIDRGVVPQAVKKPTRTEITNATKVKHARQSDKDAQMLPTDVNVEREMSRWSGIGQPPLHVLNAIAEQADRQIRDEGKEIATAAGKAAYETYVGKLKSKRSRHAHMRAQIAAGEAKLAQDKAKEAS